jgi:cation transport ATPase
METIFLTYSKTFADKVAGRFVPAVILLALATFTIWLIIATTVGIPAPYNEPGNFSPQKFSIPKNIFLVTHHQE